MLRIQVFQHFNGLQGLFPKKQVFSGKGSVFHMSHSTSVHVPKSGMASVPVSHTEVSQDTSVIHTLALALGLCRWSSKEDQEDWHTCWW